MERPIRKASVIAKITLRMRFGVKPVQRFDLQLFLANFGPVTVVAQHVFEKFHDVTCHLCHPVGNDLQARLI